jgi:two-component system, response regulator PdtaR
MVSSNILIVEDEIIIAIDLKIRLENLGYYVPGIAVNGKDAIKKTGDKNPDLVLMNVLLNGDIDGIDVAQKIRNLYNIPVIYLTCSDDNTIVDKAKSTNPLGFINKPFNDTEIHDAIELAMEGTKV